MSNDACRCFNARLPQVNADLLRERLWNEYHIEVPVGAWHDQVRMRISFQGYNDSSDADRLVEALARLLPGVAV
jgi:selenocysteine lyase/cysteine desulfurase